MESSGKKSKSTSKSKKQKKRRRRFSGAKIDIMVTDCYVSSVPDPPNPSKKKGDEVRWSSDGGTYAVTFVPANPVRPSPFDKDVFIVKPVGKTPSGRITLPDPIPAGGLDFKYRVVGDNGCDIDPIIHIRP